MYSIGIMSWINTFLLIIINQSYPFKVNFKEMWQFFCINCTLISFSKRISINASRTPVQGSWNFLPSFYSRGDPHVLCSTQKHFIVLTMDFHNRAKCFADSWRKIISFWISYTSVCIESSSTYKLRWI